jgi:hypothetical protein
MKLYAFSSFVSNKNIINLLHVPWDSYTLKPLLNIYKDEDFAIPKSPGQGSVKSKEMYYSLQNFISEIAIKAGVPRIYYDLMAWDNR